MSQHTKTDEVALTFAHFLFSHVSGLPERVCKACIPEWDDALAAFVASLPRFDTRVDQRRRDREDAQLRVAHDAWMTENPELLAWCQEGSF